MKQIIIVLLAIILSIASLPVLVFAQAAQNGGTYLNGQTPDTFNGTQRGISSIDKNVDYVGSFDWRWLVPLLAIPVVFLLWRTVADGEKYGYRNPSYYQYAGVKGGKARRTKRVVDKKKKNKI
jgi:hypothetical protein